MKAIAITPGVPEATLITIEEPQISTPTQVKIKVLEVGICGTDREEVMGGRADAPEDDPHLIIGHEMMGEVVETGAEVANVRVGDYAVLTVRRGCGQCDACLHNRSDLCYTGNYRERGIKALHGFETEYVVDDERFVIKVPETAREIGVLAEPMSVVQKAIMEAVAIQSARLAFTDESWLAGKKAVVAGIGAIGLLAVIALRLRGVEVIGIDIVDESSKRPQLLKELGGTYVDARQIDIKDLDRRFGEMDFIFEAAGAAQLGFDLIDVLGINGIYVMTGIPGEGKPVCFPGAEAMSQIVLKNQLILGSVNAAPYHFESGLKDLEKAVNRWGDLIRELITARVDSGDFARALDFRSEDDIKTVILWK